MKHMVLIGLVLLLSACSTPSLSTSLPTPVAINLSYPASLTPWADKLTGCAANNPFISLYLFSTSTSNKRVLDNEIVLELGEPSQDYSGLFLSQVGWEQLVVLVNLDNKLSKLSTDELRSIYSGQVTRWENGSGNIIQVWVLPKGDAARMIFDNAVLSSQTLTSEAMLAPDPGAMLEAIARDANAIGYLPISALNSGDQSNVSRIKTIQLDQPIEENLNQPVIAITQSEPTGLMRVLVVCLQDAVP
jgi:phosphate transport system substrate-binding protein